MKYPNEPVAFSAGSQLHTAMRMAIAEIALMPEGEQRAWALRGVASMLIGTPDSCKAEAVEHCPELASADPIPDTHLSSEQIEAASNLTSADMEALDRALIAGTTASWRRMARVVGDAMVALQGHASQLPLGLYVQRIEALVENGRLQAQGNTQFIRLSEVRLPTRSTSAA